MGKLVGRERTPAPPKKRFGLLPSRMQSKGPQPSSQHIEKQGPAIQSGETDDFPQRTAALQRFHNPSVVQILDDGTLTIKAHGKLHVVTPDGKVFEQKES